MPRIQQDEESRGDLPVQDVNIGRGGVVPIGPVCLPRGEAVGQSGGLTS